LFGDGLSKGHADVGSREIVGSGGGHVSGETDVGNGLKVRFTTAGAR